MYTFLERYPHGIFAAGGSLVPTQEKKNKKTYRLKNNVIFLQTILSFVLPRKILVYSFIPTESNSDHNGTNKRNT